MGNYVFSSESVSEGHPDKVCDAVSDAVVDACLAKDRRSRVACETMVKTGYVIVAGEISVRPVGPQRGDSPQPSSPRTNVRESKVTIKIPRPLYRKIQQVVEESGFDSATDFVVYVLRDLMGETEVAEEPEFTQDELDDVKRKLKNLGYL